MIQLPITPTGILKRKSIDDNVAKFLLEKYGEIDIIAAAYCYYHNITIPKCVCGNNLKFASFTKGFNKTCGNAKCQEEQKALTCLEKYGVKNVFLDKNIKRKIQTTCLERHGVDHPSKSKVSKEKRHKTWSNNGGHPMQRHFNIHLFNNQNSLKELINKKRIEEVCSEHNISYSFLCQRLNAHDVEFPHQSITKPHLEIYEFIKSLGLTCKLNDRTKISPLEIDIVVDDLAIEVNGLYWHSYSHLESIEEKNKHLDKYKRCMDANLRFLSITDFEWYTNQDIIKSIIKNRLRINRKKIYARQTQFKEVDLETSKNFLIENHLMGNIGSKFKYGLFYNDELVSLATFGVNRFDNKECELIRLCHKKDLSIVGGTSKLISNFMDLHNINKLVSYSHNDKFDGSSYIKSGFFLDKINPPSYYYLRSDVGIVNRLSMQKHKLKKKLEMFDKNLSEAQNCFNNGYRRYWDCGTTKWVKEIL